MRYETYINSIPWSIKKKEAYLHHGYHCCRCGENRKGFLQVHHIHYKTLTNESVEKDLAILCKNCHAEYHALFGDADRFSFNKFTSWNKPKKSKGEKKKEKQSKRDRKKYIQKLKKTTNKVYSLEYRANKAQFKIEKAKRIIEEMSRGRENNYG